MLEQQFDWSGLGLLILGGGAISPVDFEKWHCRTSQLTFIYPCRMSLFPMSPVDFKKGPCCPLGYMGQGPYSLDLHSYDDPCMMIGWGLAHAPPCIRPHMYVNQVPFH